MSADSNNCNDFALPDKLYMASSLLDFVLYALAGVPGDLEVPEKSGIGLCYMLGHCQNLIDMAEQESAALVGEQNTQRIGKNPPANLTAECLKIIQRGTSDLEAKKKNANEPGINERDTSEQATNGPPPDEPGINDQGTNHSSTNESDTNESGAANPDTATPEATIHTTLKAVWVLPDRPIPNNNNNNWQQDLQLRYAVAHALAGVVENVKEYE